MENASKALIIAATVLIAVLILSIGAYLFTYYSQIAYENEQNKINQSLVQYNTKFEKYEDKQLTIQDVLTITNLAKDYNERKSVDGINVNINGNSTLGRDNDWWIKQLDENSNTIYEIEYILKYDNGTIKEIRIAKK